MADIKLQVNALIGLLQKFAGESDEAKDALEQFSPILDSFVKGRVVSDWGSLATAINSVSVALTNLGVSGIGIEKIRTNLQTLAAEYRYFGGQFATKRAEAVEVPSTGLLSNLGAIRAQREALVRSRIEAQTTTSDQLANIRAQQDAQYAARKQEIAPQFVHFDNAAGRERIRAEQDARVAREQREQRAPEINRQLFTDSEQMAEVTRRWAEEVEKVELAYKKTYSGWVEYRRAKLSGEADDDAKREGLKGDARRAKGEEPIPLREALQKYEDFIPGGEVGIENLTARLEALGVTEVNTVQATREISNGITSMSVKMTETSGAVTRGTVHMDKFGNVLRDTSRRFRSFSDAIGTNIIKVTQWAVATGVVYGIVRQLGQVLKEIIEIQSKLAEVQIAIGINQGDLNKVFEEAVNIANLTSSSVAGVVEAYALAYRATGAYTNEAERLAVTNKLLQESMILAKLAGTDQATALDTLVGALRQTGLELDQGRDLLDKWVFVSRQANVSLDTLAQTYAIVGTSAKGVGIEIEELNALAATLAEATGLSATETGNAIRGIIAGFQSASAEKTLGRFGIATRDATGQLRDFMSLYEELAILTQSGILSERDITEIANAIGGGYRRGAQVETLLKNNLRVYQLTADQAGASGSAAEALEIKMETLESAITRLGNAFTQFAQTLGSEGGFLEIITAVVDSMTGILTAINGLVDGLGKATPALLAFAAAWTVLGSAKGQSLFKGLLGRGAGGLLTGAAGRLGAGPLATQQILSARMAQIAGVGVGAGAAPAGYTIGGALGGIRGGLQKRLGGVDPLGLIAPALIAGGAFKNYFKTREEDPVGAGLEAGRGITTIIGAIVGGIVTAGNPLGIAAGSAMASSFYQAVVQYDDDLVAWWTTIIREGREDAKEDEDEDSTLPDDIEDAFEFGARLFAGAASVWGTVLTWTAPTGEGGLFGTGIASRRGLDELDPEGFLVGLAQQQQGIDVGIGGGLIDWANLLVPEETGKAVMDRLADTFTSEDIDFDLSNEITESVEKLKPIVGPVIADFMEDARREFILGDISAQEFIKLPQDIDETKLALSLAKVTQAAGFADIAIDVEEFTLFMLELDETTRKYVTTLSDQVVTAYAEWQKELVNTEATIESIAKAEADFLEKQRFFQVTVPAVQQQHEISTIDRLQVFDAGRATPQQVQTATALAQSFTKAYYLRIAEGNEENAGKMVAQLNDLLVKYGEGIGQRFGESISGTTAQAMAEAFKALDYDDLLGDVKFQFQDLRDSLSLEDIPELMRRYQKVVGTFQTFFPAYDIDEQEVGLITKNGFATEHADLTLLNLAMQDLIDVNEKQLEGVWNIPSGMTAMVAWSSLFSRNLPASDVFAGEDDVFTEDRVPETGTEAVNIEAQIAELTEKILGLQNVLSRVTAQDIGSPAFDTMTAELAALQAERADLVDQLNLQQFATGLGIELPEANLLDQFRDALTIQNRVEFNTNIRLVVDGRTLANVVKQYLFEDLAAASDKTAGTGGGNYVIK